jgi:hypothetical protein
MDRSRAKAINARRNDFTRNDFTRDSGAGEDDFAASAALPWLNQATAQGNRAEAGSRPDFPCRFIFVGWARRTARTCIWPSARASKSTAAACDNSRRTCISDTECKSAARACRNSHRTRNSWHRARTESASRNNRPRNTGRNSGRRRANSRSRRSNLRRRPPHSRANRRRPTGPIGPLDRRNVAYSWPFSVKTANH